MDIVYPGSNKLNISDYYIFFLIFYSNITYYPFLTFNPLINNLTKLLWLILFIGLLYKEQEIYKSLFVYVIPILLFDLLIIILEILSDGNYVFSRFVYPLHLCLFIVVIGSLIGKNITEKKMIFFMKSYVISSFVLSFLIYKNYYLGVNWINSMETIIVQKNGIALLFLTSLVILIFQKNIFNKYVKFSLLVYFSLFIIIMKSRTVILGCFLLFIYYFFKISKKNKMRIILLGSLFFFLMFNFTNLIDMFIYNILFNNRIEYGFNAITSGRQSHFSIFMENFRMHPIFGHGTFYLESFPLAALLSYGILGSSILLFISLLPIIEERKHNRSNMYHIKTILYALWVIMMVNGIFEELAPFGPGIKCYMLWLFTGLNHTVDRVRSKGSME